MYLKKLLALIGDVDNNKIWCDEATDDLWQFSPCWDVQANLTHVTIWLPNDCQCLTASINKSDEFVKSYILRSIKDVQCTICLFPALWLC